MRACAEGAARTLRGMHCLVKAVFQRGVATRMNKQAISASLSRFLRILVSVALIITLTPFTQAQVAFADSNTSESPTSEVTVTADSETALNDEESQATEEAESPDASDLEVTEPDQELASLSDTLTDKPSEDIADDAEFATDEVVIVYEDDKIELDEELPELADVKESTIKDLGVVEQEVIADDLGSEGDVAIAKIADDITVEEAVDKLSSLDGVAYVEPNYSFGLDATYVNDTYFSNQYYLQTACFLDAWDQVRTNKAVQVAVLDSGVRIDHQDLRAQINTSLAYDALNDRRLTSSNVANGGDSYGHGTMVAGVLGATANNGFGIAGAAYNNVEIIPVRVFEGEKSNLSNIVVGLQYVIEILRNGQAKNLKVVNMSFGSTEANSAALHSLINSLYYNYGVVCVCAAGNQGSTASYYPGDWNECFSVTAITQYGTECSWSNYNSAKDISAPGELIYTTSNTSTTAIAQTEGTSFSAPLVSAACALLAIADPSADPRKIMTAIQQSATKISNKRPANGSAGALNTTAALALLTGKNIVDLDAISVTATRGINGQSYTLVASGSTLPNATSVQFPVWSNVNGQDDIHWYSGVKNSRGDWVVSVPLTNHKSHGSYSVHVYATFFGRQMFVGSTSFSVAAPVTSISGVANRANGSITYTVTISSSIGISRVQLPVWCNSIGGQDDVRWYDLTSPTVSGSTYTYTKTIYLSDHKYQSGIYAAHLYAYDGIGVLAPLKVCNLSNVQLPPITLDYTHTTDGMVYTITARGGYLPRASSVQVPVWSTSGGQDDIVWYRATKQLNGTFVARAYISNHRTAGEYLAHVYATFGVDTAFMGAMGFNVAGPTTAVHATHDMTNGRIDYTVTVNSSYGIARVELPVWCSTINGQDDIQWYTLTSPKVSGSTYVYTKTVYLSNHRYQTGTYDAHVYAYDSRNILAPVSQLRRDGIQLPPITLDYTKSSDGMSYIVTAKGGYLSQATEVQIPTWSVSNGQDDVNWYRAARQYDASYTARINLSFHKTAGQYLSHVYARLGGELIFMGSSSFNIANAATSITADKSPENGSITYKITIDSERGVASGQLPVWCSTVGGQDDIVWYSLNQPRVFGTSYIYDLTISMASHHAQIGTYTAHLYAYDRAGIPVAFSSINVGGMTVPPSDVLAKPISLVGVQPTYGITVKGGIASKASAVSVPVWSKTNGQDDIIWYTASRNSSGEWSVMVPIRNHKHLGTFIAHVYGIFSGEMVLLGSTTFSQ